MSIEDKYLRLDKFLKQRIEEDIYPEPTSDFHASITRQMIEVLSKKTNLIGKSVLDCGCGQGFALKIFKENGANPTGITFGEDYQVCKSEGFDVYEMDQSFLNFPKETFDLIWSRHALEHSIFPLFTLAGFYDVLKPDGMLYVEVPAPETDCHHELNKNHYSCFTKKVWLALFEKAKFKVIELIDIKFKVVAGDDVYHAFYLIKK